MTLRICHDANPCPGDQPLDNFSSEANDTLDFFSTFFAGQPPPLLRNWSATECNQTFVSTISQLDADLQARAIAETCVLTHTNPTGQIFLNNPQTCCVPCPDGTNTCYTLPGGLFSGLSQQSVDSMAHQVACDLVFRNQVCISQFPKCMCVGDTYSATVTSNVPATWSLSGGSLPPGLTISFTSVSATITGVASTSGMFTFQLTAQTAAGPYTIKTFTLTVLQITTVALQGFTIGAPYAFQMMATGGSGNYNWTITSGSLPIGLSMSLTGLISGTPTSNGVNPLVFKAIDLNCESTDQSFFPPRVVLSTQSTTKIATVLGWSEMPGFVSSPPKKFKTVTWIGSSEQQLWFICCGIIDANIQKYTGANPNSDLVVPPFPQNQHQFCAKSGSPLYVWDVPTQKWIVSADQTIVSQVGGARYDFGGIDAIDEFGNVTNTHTKNVSVMCNSSINLNTIIGPPIPNTNASKAAPFTGYFGTNRTQYSNLFGPTEVCASASIPYAGIGDIATNSPFTFPAADLNGLWGSTSESGGNAFLGVATITFPSNTVGQSIDSGVDQTPSRFAMNPYALTSPAGQIQVFGSIATPIGIIPLPFDWASACAVVFTNNFSATLSNEYTDSEALLNAQVIQGNGAVAQNAQRTTGFVSSFTNVIYTLTCSNLINGQNYTVSVDLADLTAGTLNTVAQTFTAVGTTKAIVTTIPTPAVGHSVQVRNPRITFA